MILLKNEELMAKIGELMGKSHPGVTRIEALKLCQVLLVRVNELHSLKFGD